MPVVTARWAGIVRVSHVGRRHGESFHADRDQITDLERAITTMPGAQLDILPPELDVSGGLPLEQRPSLLAAVEGVERGEYAGIIVAYLSRLGRSVREQLKAWDRVEAAGGRIIVVREGIDTSTANGRFQRNILLAVAEQEREQHAERFEERREAATRAGIWQRRQTPRGYIRGEKRRLQIDPATAPDVRAAFRARGAGRPLVQIADDLQMTPAGVRHLLSNRVYLGELKVGRHINPQAHEPLVDAATFAAAQAPRTTRRPRAAREPALLAGLVRCCGCGHVMSRSTTAREVYACRARHSLGRCPEPASITAALCDQLVEQIAVSHIRALAAQPVVDDGRLADAHAAVTAAEAELHAFLAGVQAARIDPADFASAVATRRERVDEARLQLGRVSAAEVPAVSGDLVAAWEVMSAGQRNTVLRGLVEAVLVERAGGRGARRRPVDRVRVIAAGSGVVDLRNFADRGRPVARLPLPPADDPAVLRV